MPAVAIAGSHHAITLVGRGMAEGWPLVSFQARSWTSRTAGIGLEKGAALLHEAGTVEFPVILQMEDEGRLHPGIGLVDQPDLAHPLPGAEILGPEAGADSGRIRVAVLRHQNARYPALPSPAPGSFRRVRASRS